ncbi:MAG: hypothetical protein VW707_08325, partial [Candidatus Puniceispirillum sp.]
LTALHAGFSANQASVNISAKSRGRANMAYIENRLVHDADSHLMEMSDCLNPYFEKSLLNRFLEHPNLGVRVGNRLAIEDALKRQEDQVFRASAGENIMLRKN